MEWRLVASFVSFSFSMCNSCDQFVNQVTAIPITIPIITTIANINLQKFKKNQIIELNV